MTGGHDAKSRRLEERFGASGGVRLRHVGPGVEAVAAALLAHETRPRRGRSSLPPSPGVEDVRVALALLGPYLDEVTAIRGRIIGAARTIDPASGKPWLTWQEIGEALGYPAGSAKQRASKLARRLGVDDASRTA